MRESRAVTLICAPPGTGKTVLVSDWVASRPDVLTTWLDIDQRTNDGDVLVQDLAVRFEALGVVAGPVESDGDPVGRLLGRLGNARPPAAHVVAVLDDAHEITDRRVWRDLERLSSDSPPWLHWVIVTRVDPPLSVQRLRLQGRLAQIRSADLAFDVDETMALMQWFGLEIPPDATRRLVTWSEGWAAALCLAARTMLSEDPHSRPWERLQASESFVMDFLVQEVFERLSAADREFLCARASPTSSHLSWRLISRAIQPREDSCIVSSVPGRSCWRSIPAATGTGITV